MADLDKIFAEAAEIAKKLPENLQESAFNRALDELLAQTDHKPPAKKKAASRKQVPSKTNPGAEARKSENFLDAINRTNYPDIGDTDRVADRALKVLQLANDDLGIDGLTASQIAEILTKKFRLTANANGINMALQRESQTVDVRTGEDGKNIFHIMAPGEDYLEKLRSGEIEPRARRSSKAATKKAVSKKTKKKTATRKKASNGKGAGKKTNKSGSKSLGPKAAISKLIDAGFFKNPRQISEIQEELKHNKGHTYSIQELSPTLLRCVRSETLSRSRSESGQYEYSEA